MQLNIVKFAKVVEAAKAAAPADWAHRIEHAANELISNPYISEEGDGLLILSDSGRIYHANGECQCVAYKFHQPCWHRIAAKLVKRYKQRGH